MHHLFNRAVLAQRSVQEQHTHFAHIARTESMLASDLDIPTWRLRVLRWTGCAPEAIRFDGTVYYTFDAISRWLRPLK